MNLPENQNRIIIETADNIEIASALNKRLTQKVNIMVEVATSSEESKEGCPPNEIIDLVKKIQLLPNIQFIGLMTIADPSNTE